MAFKLGERLKCYYSTYAYLHWTVLHGITAVYKTDNEATIDSLKEALEFAELWKKNGRQFKLCVQNPSLNLRVVSPNRK